MRFLIFATFVVVTTSSFMPWDARSERTWGMGYPPAHRSTTVRKTPMTVTAKNEVDSISRLLINVEQKMMKFCRKYTIRPLVENYGPEFYRLRVNLTGCSEDGVEVRAGQRLVAVQAKDPRCNYIALRLLPYVVDSNSAYWRFSDGHLVIMFPYSSGHGERVCGRPISDTIHSLPKFDNDAQDLEVDVNLSEVGSGSAHDIYMNPDVTEKWY